MNREKFTEDYKFRVKKEKGYDEYSGVVGYSVSLPHQCDSWEIIGANDPDSDIPHNNLYPCLPTSKDFAISQMELFIQRANEALEKLKAL